jgi:hypothetical protein
MNTILEEPILLETGKLGQTTQEDLFREQLVAKAAKLTTGELTQKETEEINESIEWHKSLMNRIVKVQDLEQRSKEPVHNP